MFDTDEWSMLSCLEKSLLRIYSFYLDCVCLQSDAYFLSSHWRGRMGAKEFCNILLICLTQILSRSDYRKRLLIWEWKLENSPLLKKWKPLYLETELTEAWRHPMYIHADRIYIFYLHKHKSAISTCLQYPCWSFWFYRSQPSKWKVLDLHETNLSQYCLTMHLSTVTCRQPQSAWLNASPALSKRTCW